MGRKERVRHVDNDKARDILEISKTRPLTDGEISELKRYYTGAGGLYSGGWGHGQFFTPRPVTEFVVDLIGITDGEFLEPSCGAGAFLNVLPATAKVTAVEYMTETAAVAQLCYPEVCIFTGDALTMIEDFKGRFDCVLGNPPFMKINKNQYDGFEFTAKSDRSEWRFIELAFNALKPGGVLAMVVPDGILGNSKDQPYRKYIMEHGVLRAVISLPADTFFFTGTGVKTSVLVLQKKVPRVDYGNYQVFFSVVDHIGWDSRGRMTGKCDLPKVLDKFRAIYPTGIHPELVHGVAEGFDELEVKTETAEQAQHAVVEPVMSEEAVVIKNNVEVEVVLPARDRGKRHANQLTLQF